MIKITLQDWITSSGSYPDRANSAELTQAIKDEAQKTIDAVNAILDQVGYTGKRIISSGFRPSNINANVKGAAKRSAHMTGLAVDLWQPKGNNEIGRLIRLKQGKQGKVGILGKNGLMMERLEKTIGKNSSWCHLDRVARSERPDMEFDP